MGRRNVVDLSHSLDKDIPMFPGLPAPEIVEYLSREASREHYSGGTEFAIHRYTIVGNSGTYLDGPYHRYADAPDLATLSLECTVDLPGVMLDCSGWVAAGRLAIDADDFDGLELGGCALLIRTGWDERWGDSSYLESNPHLTAAAADVLVAVGVMLVGIDSWNVDDTTDGERPVHSKLLRARIPVIENLRGLAQLPPDGFHFSAAPLPFRGGSAVPVRAYALLDQD